IADNMTGKTICVLSDSCATPVVSGLKKFRGEFEAKIQISRNKIVSPGLPTSTPPGAPSRASAA
ncbi:MAG: NADH-ubiquinone oxidoreductase-F iron-sulfur binding region domain-containing protein, partial [Gemmatimonas sp.]